MKKYKVSRHYINHPYGSSLSAFCTCVHWFDSMEEVEEVISSLREMFPDAFINEVSGNLTRKMEVREFYHSTWADTDIAYIEPKTIFWQIMEYSDNELPRPLPVED